MGLIDRLWGRDDSGGSSAGPGGKAANDREGTSPVKQEDGTPVHRVLFIDDDPIEKSLLDYRLIIGPHPEGGFAVYRCNEPTQVPSGSGLHLFESGDVVFPDNPHTAKNGHRAHLAELLPPKQYEDAISAGLDNELMRFPSELADVNIPKRSEWTDRELNYLLVSISVKRNDDVF